MTCSIDRDVVCLMLHIKDGGRLILVQARIRAHIVSSHGGGLPRNFRGHGSDRFASGLHDSNQQAISQQQSTWKRRDPPS
jgi:hypothetical protein